jgi:YD repeat-containing protein
MYIKLTVAMLAMLQSLILMADELPRPTPYQSDATITNKISTGEKSHMSDREKAGLRGPVQQCTEERTTPAFENFPATSDVSINKYSPEGRIIEAATGNSIESPPEFSTTYTYDSTGRLLKKTTTTSGSPASESKYNYDQKGRIISITGDPFGTSTFEMRRQGPQDSHRVAPVQTGNPGGHSLHDSRPRRRRFLPSHPRRRPRQNFV